MRILGKSQKGLSLIEMIIALVIAAVIIAGVYRTFTVQQKAFVVQEEVSAVQQSVRAVMDLIARDIRMAGYGRPSWAVGGFPNSVTITSTSPADFTVVGAFSGPVSTLSADANINDFQITLVDSVELNAGENLLIFEPDTLPITPATPLRYKTVAVFTGTGAGGSNTIDMDADGSTTGAGNQDPMDVKLRATSLVYKVDWVTYRLNGNTLFRDQSGNQSVLATNVTSFQITDQYNPAVPETFGSYLIDLTVETRTNDPDFPGGVRTRTLTSTIKARNLSMS